METSSRTANMSAVKEAINQSLVMRQIDTNTLNKEFGQVVVNAAKVQAQLSSVDSDEANLNSESLNTLANLRSYQQCLVNLCLDGKLEKDKFVAQMKNAHGQFLATKKHLTQERKERMELNKQMLVDDWDQNSGNEEYKAAANLQLNAEYTQISQYETIQRDEFSYSLLEAFWMRRQMIDPEDEQGLQTYNERVKDMYVELQAKNIVRSNQAQEILDKGTLDYLGLKGEFLFKNIIRYRTIHCFAQKKFNLMREESEGYSKLLIELNQENIDRKNVSIVKENIQKLVGYFQLDPNRLLDLILSSFENNIRNQAYLDLIKEFGQKNQVTQLIGFKIQHALKLCNIGADGLPIEEKSSDEAIQESQFQLVDQSLFDLTAMLIKHEVISLEEIWSHIESKLDLTSDEANGDEIDLLLDNQVKDLDYQYQLMFKTIMNAEQFEKEMAEQKILEKHANIEAKRAKMHFNFKIRLLQSCINVNDWVAADEIVNGIYDGKLDLSWSRPVLNAIFNALDWSISKLYKAINPARNILLNRFGKGKFQLKVTEIDYFFDGSPRSIRQATSVDETLFEDLQKVLNVVGVYLAHDEKVFQKVLKVVNYAIEQKPHFVQTAVIMCSEVFVPAHALVSANYAIEGDIWEIFKHGDFNQRYSCYSTMLKATYLSQPCLISKQISVHKKFSKWARRLVDANEMRTKTRQFSKIAYGNSILAFDMMVTTARSYENQIEAQIQAISCCQDLALDMMAFMIVKHMADTTESPLDQNQNVAKWLINLSDLASQFYKKFPQVEMTGLFTYLIHKLRDENCFVLSYMINQIISKMFGWSDLVINQLQPDQLNVLAAGFVFMLQGKNQQQQLRNNKKPTEALRNLFWDPKTNNHQMIGLRLMVGLAQQSQFVANKFDTDKLILVARQYDKMQVYFTHMVDTLKFLADSQKKFSLLLPENPARSLSYDYRLPPQHVFQILRCGLPPIYKLSPEQFTQLVADFKQVLELSWQSRLDVASTSEATQENVYWDEIQFLSTKKQDLWVHLKPELYTIFWYMNIQNLTVPEKLYNEEIKNINVRINKLNDQIKTLQTSKIPLDAMTSNRQSNSENVKKSQKEVLELSRCLRDLQKELDFQTQQQKDSYTFLKKKITELFQSDESASPHELSIVMVQYCFFPRLMHSAKDALFAFEFCKMLHKLRVPYFNFLSFFGQIMKRIVPAIHFCSEEEAENLGIFFLELFKQLDFWSKDENWQRECQGYCGFARKLADPKMTITRQDFVDKIITSIHKRISAAINFCFDKSDKMYMKTRCALIILNRVSPFFPNTHFIAKSIQSQLQGLVDAKSDINQDLWTLAGRLNEKLKEKVATFPEHAEEKKAEEKKQIQLKEQAEAVAKKKVSDERETKSKPRDQGTSSASRHDSQKEGPRSDRGGSSRPVDASHAALKSDRQRDNTSSRRVEEIKERREQNHSSKNQPDSFSRKSNDQDREMNKRSVTDKSKVDLDDQHTRKVQRQPGSSFTSQQPSANNKAKNKAEEKQTQRQVLQVERAKPSEQPTSSSIKKPDSRDETKPSSLQQTPTTIAGSKRTAAQSSSTLIVQKDDQRKDQSATSTGDQFKDPGQSKRPKPVGTDSSSSNVKGPASYSNMRDNQSRASGGVKPATDTTNRDTPNRNREENTQARSGNQKAPDHSASKEKEDRSPRLAAHETKSKISITSAARTGDNLPQRRDESDHYNVGRNEDGRRGGDSHFGGRSNQGAGTDRNDHRDTYHGTRDHRSDNRGFEQGNNQVNVQGRGRDRDDGVRHDMRGGAGNRSPRRGPHGQERNEDYFPLQDARGDNSNNYGNNERGNFRGERGGNQRYQGSGQRNRR